MQQYDHQCLLVALAMFVGNRYTVVDQASHCSIVVVLTKGVRATFRI